MACYKPYSSTQAVLGIGSKVLQNLGNNVE